MENKFNKKKVIMAVLTALAITAVLGSIIAICMKDKKGSNEKIASEISEVLTAEDDEKINAEVDAAIEEYLKKFSKQTTFSSVMTNADKSALGKDILTELSKDMTDEQLTQMKEILVKLFSDDSTLTITGSAYFSDETRAYINKNIQAAVHDAISGYSSDGGEHYTELQTTVEKIVKESVGDSSVGYSLGAVDLDNIKQSVLASIGSVKGEIGATGAAGPAGRDGADGKDGIDGKDGADGKNGENGKDGEDGKNGVDGRDGRDGKDGVNGTNGKDGADGRDGKDGYTPVKGTDYFTEKEIDSIVSTITGSMEKYVNGIAPVKGKDYFTDEEIRAISDSVKADMTDLFNESIEKITKSYEAALSDATTSFNESMTAFQSDMEAKFSNLSERTDKKLSDMESETDSKIESFSDETDAKIKKLEDGKVTYELIRGSDGTYTLKITDPKNQ